MFTGVISRQIFLIEAQGCQDSMRRLDLARATKGLQAR